MRRLNSLLCLLVWGLLQSAGAQPTGTAEPPVVVELRTNLPDAVVFADSLRLGPASQQSFLVPAGTEQIRLVAGGPDAWTVAPRSAPLEAVPGDTVALELRFPHYYQIETFPYGASVFLETPSGRQKLGETPLLYRAEEPLRDPLLLERSAFVVHRITPGNDVWNHYSVALEPAREPEPRAAEVPWHPPSKPNRWIDYASVGLALAGGILAVQQKFRADDLYDQYRETGDPTLRPQIKRHDVRAGVALGAMQVGIGVFALRLALR